MVENADDTLEFYRHQTGVTVAYTLFYSLVFLIGLLGNTFVVRTVVSNRQFRTTTDYLISSLAVADLLIILFCLPTTLLNNILTEWHLGGLICKMSTWLNSTTSCASIYTLVFVTADRFFAICHTLKYQTWDTHYTLHVIGVIWLASSLLASPNLLWYNEVAYNFTTENNTTLTCKLCFSTTDEKSYFVSVNLILAFCVPFLLISIFYSLIFIRVSTHTSLAVDAQIRDERIKVRVAKMMFLVIIVFAICWIPLYMIYFYFFFIADQTSTVFMISSIFLRPFFQWLSLTSSCINPIIYCLYSQKYRKAALSSFCPNSYEKVRGVSSRETETTKLTRNGTISVRRQEGVEEWRREESSLGSLIHSPVGTSVL